jgi:hypothetical protein
MLLWAFFLVLECGNRAQSLYAISVKPCILHCVTQPMLVHNSLQIIYSVFLLGYVYISTFQLVIEIRLLANFGKYTKL